MADENLKPTHLLTVVLRTGVAVPLRYNETTDQFSDLGENHIFLTKADGSRHVFRREAVEYYSVQPWKELPDSVKQNLEKAKATPSRYGPN